MTKFLIPFTGRNYSGSSSDNVLWREKNIYVMDNHRLALWCWFQEIRKEERYNLFHIDAHPDLSESGVPFFNHDLWNMALEDYRKAWQSDINEPLFRWDNYLSFFLSKYADNIAHTISATHHLGSLKGLKEDIGPVFLIKRLNEIINDKVYVNDFPWIINLDLDYFFSSQPEKLPLFSEEFLNSLSAILKTGLENGMIKVLTIALSPECCGGWGKAEESLFKLFNIQLH